MLLQNRLSSLQCIVSLGHQSPDFPGLRVVVVVVGLAIFNNI